MTIRVDATTTESQTMDNPDPQPNTTARTWSWSTRRLGTLGWTLAGLVLASAVWSLAVATGQFPRQLFPSVPEILTAGQTLWSDGWQPMSWRACGGPQPAF